MCKVISIIKDAQGTYACYVNEAEYFIEECYREQCGRIIKYIDASEYSGLILRRDEMEKIYDSKTKTKYKSSLFILALYFISILMTIIYGFNPENKLILITLCTLLIIGVVGIATYSKLGGRI